MLRKCLQLSVITSLIGALVIGLLQGREALLWFVLGSGLALVNLGVAAMVVRIGIGSIRNKGLFLGLLLMKTLTFLGVVAAFLVFMKPQLLPFTIGLGVVIFGSVFAALLESRHYFKNA